MASYNRVILVGNITRDITLKYTASGTAVTEIGLAVNEKRKQGEEWIDEVVFIDVTLWGRTAEVANEYLGKGSPCLIEGRLKLDTWEQEGQKRSKLKVVGERMQMLGSKGDGQQGQAQQQQRPQTQQNDVQKQKQSPPQAQQQNFAGNNDGYDVPF